VLLPPDFRVQGVKFIYNVLHWLTMNCAHHFFGSSRGLALIVFFLAARILPAQNVQRGEMEDVLKIVSADVQKTFYDPNMKGLDWPALTEETRQQIRNSNNMGQMILAIFVLLPKLGDSHTYFVPPRLTEQADFGFKARPYGNEIRVYEVAEKGPAAKAQLGVGDKILSLNGIPVDRDNIGQVLPLLEKVVPANALELETITSDGQSRKVHIPAHMILAQEHQYLDSVWRVADQQHARDVRVPFSNKDYGDGVTYVGIPSFQGSPEGTYSAIKKAEHSRALVLDLRGNGGGWRDTLLAFLGFFSQRPQVLAKRMLRTQSEDLTIKPQYSGFDASVVVLVDSASASAAELAARHLQLNYKALVLGDRTSGKVNDGYVIREKIGARFVMPFAVVVSDAKLVMPDGGELEGHGVIPDVPCVPTPENLRQRIDPCLDQAIALAKKALPPRTN
jgi:C-terminal processing protease CtpA/Prc